MLITNGNLHQKGMRRRTVNRQVNFGPVTLRVVTIVIFALAAFIALAQSTASATQGYALSQEQDKLGVEKENLEALKIQAARGRALDAIMADTMASPSPSPQLEEPKEINSLPEDFSGSAITYSAR